MEKYFDLVLDLLEIEEKSELSELAKMLDSAQKDGKSIKIYHRYSFLLNAWLKLLAGEIPPEEFVLVGDVDSSFPLLQEGEKTSQECIKDLKNGLFPEQDLLIVDRLAWNLYLTPDEQKDIITAFAEKKKTLIAK